MANYPNYGDMETLFSGIGQSIEENGLGKKLTATVSGATVSFTDSAIPAGVIDGPYIADLQMGVEKVVISSNTAAFTLSNSSANGKTAYIWVRTSS